MGSFCLLLLCVLPSFLVQRVVEGAPSPGRAPTGTEGGGAAGVMGDPGSLAPLGSRLVFTCRDGASASRGTMWHAHLGTDMLQVETH